MKTPEPVEEEKPEGQVVNMGKGEATRYSKPPNREALWSMRWKSAQVEYFGDEDFGGSMQGVSGSLFDGDKEVSEFTADHAFADKKSDLLRLDGRIRVTSKEGGAVMTCDKLDWIASRKVVQASGSVKIDTDAYSLGTFKELWVTPDLDTAGTPDTFGRKG